MSATDQHQCGGAGVAFDEKFRAVAGSDELVGPQATHAIGRFQGRTIQLGGTQRPFHGAVFSEKDLGAQLSRAVHYRCHGDGRAALVGFQYLASIGEIAGWRPTML